MSADTILELIGYFASFLVLISLLMTSVVKLRIINTIGSLIFAIYAVLIRSYPTAVMNFCLVGINLYFLWKLSRSRVLFSMVPTSVTEAGLAHFLRFYREDIALCFPEFFLRTGEEDRAYMVYADAEPVGLLIGTPGADGSLTVKLDYSVPKYRDCSVGQYLYGRLAQDGVTSLIAAPGPEKHNRYLEKMGFVKDGGYYTRKLDEIGG